MKRLYFLFLVLMNTFSQQATASSFTDALPPIVPQGSLIANGPFCTSGRGQLTWVGTAGASFDFTIVYTDGITETMAMIKHNVPFDVDPNPLTSSKTYTVISVKGSDGGMRTSGFTQGTATITVILTGVGTLEGDRLALIDFYNATNGANWTSTTNTSTNKWIVPGTCGQSPCGWNGVTCTNGRVTSVSLTVNKLKGTIPNSIGDLTNLITLNLPNDSLSGIIPTSIGNLTNLTSLNLTNNQFSGNIPPEIGNLTKLTTLTLNGNKLTGSMPTTIGDLTNLTLLNLSSNQLSGSIPTEIGKLTNLTSLNLSINQLTGSLPSSIGNLTNLTFLSINSNKLTGSIPSSFGNLVNVTSFGLNQNQLSGSIPPELSNLAKLTVLSLFSNKLTGSIPPELGNLTKLTTLVLDTNRLTGNIPIEIGRLSLLSNLRLQANQLTGSMPDSIWNLIKLTNLNLSNNQLTGSISDSIGKLVNLNAFILNSNQLTGAIPDSIGKLINLRLLYLDTNRLTGNIPIKIGKLTLLSALRLNNNQLSGGFNLTGIPTGTASNVRIQNNNFNFDGIETNVALLDSISPQAKMPITNRTGSLWVSAGGTIGNNTYKWYRKTATTPIQSGTIRSSVYTAFVPSISGTYYVEVTNSSVPALTLISDSIKITIPQGSLSANSICGSGIGQLIWTATEGSSPFTVVYNDGTGNKTATDVISGVPFDVTANPITRNATFTLVSVTGSGADASVRKTAFTKGTATIIVNNLPAITAQPTPLTTICAGESPINLSVAATGTGLTYQWKKDGVDINGATNATFAVTSNASDAASTAIYTVSVGGVCTPSVFSENSTITINALPKITLQPAISAPLCAGDSAILSVGTTGTGLTYQWEKDGVDIANATDSMYKIRTNAADTASAFTYSVVVNGVCTPSVFSTDLTVIVHQLPKITAQPVTTTTLCAGTSTTLSVGATGSGLSFQWKKDGVDVGTNDSTLIVNSNATDAANRSIYSVQIGGVCPPSVFSENSTITINALPKITLQPAISAPLCAGDSAILSVGTTGTGLFYQWKKDGVNIVGATDSTYKVQSNAADTASTAVYSVQVGGVCTPSVLSENSTIKINALPKIIAQPALTTTLCAGTSTTLSVGATGSGLSFQWKKDGVDVGTNDSTLIVNSNATDAASTSIYSVKVGGVCTPSVFSENSTITINALPKITLQPTASTTLCAGENKTLSLGTTGTGLFYQWKKDGIDIVGATDSTYKVQSNAADTASTAVYSVQVGGVCTPSVFSENSTIKINALPRIIAQPALTTTLCAGTSTTLRVGATGSGLSFQWKKDGVDVGTNDSTLIVNSNATDAANRSIYSVQIGGVCTPSVFSENSTITINALPKITLQPTASTTLCAGENKTLSVGTTGTGLFYQWKKDGIDIVGATDSTYKVQSNAADTASTAVYSVQVGGVCTPSVLSENSTIKINALPKITAQMPSITLCVGSIATFSVAATGTGLTYQWKKDNVAISGANQATYSIAAATATDAGNYTVVVGGTCAPNVTSVPAKLVVDPILTPILGDTGVNATFKTTLTNAISGGTWTSDDPTIAQINPTTGVVTGVSFGKTIINYTLTNACGTLTVKKDFTVIRNFVKVALKAFLQGPYNPNSGFMEATLRVNGFVPSVEPYTGMTNFLHKGSGGGEIFDNQAITTVIGSNAIVDWVFVELRDKTTPSKVVSTRAALIQRDGDIVDKDGTSALTFYEVLPDNYYIAIRHRNHLGFRIAASKSLTTNTLNLNLSDGSTPLFGNNPLKLIGSTYMMYSGNGDGNGAVNAIDKNGAWLKSNGQFNYLRGDFNLDGAVNALDRNEYWLLNNSRIQQLD